MFIIRECFSAFLRPSTRRFVVELLPFSWVLSIARTKRLGCFAPTSQARFFLSVLDIVEFSDGLPLGPAPELARQFAMFSIRSRVLREKNSKFLEIGGGKSRKLWILCRPVQQIFKQTGSDFAIRGANCLMRGILGSPKCQWRVRLWRGILTRAVRRSWPRSH